MGSDWPVMPGIHPERQFLGIYPVISSLKTHSKRIDSKLSIGEETVACGHSIDARNQPFCAAAIVFVLDPKSLAECRLFNVNAIQHSQRRRN